MENFKCVNKIYDGIVKENCTDKNLCKKGLKYTKRIKKVGLFAIVLSLILIFIVPRSYITNGNLTTTSYITIFIFLDIVIILLFETIILSNNIKDIKQHINSL